MTYNFWTALGFYDNFQQTLERIRDVRSLSWNDPNGFEYITAYSDPSGATICLFAADGGYPEDTYTVQNPSGAAVEAFQVIPGTAVVNVFDESGELFTRILVMVDDPQMYPVYPMDNIGDLAHYDQYQLGAIAQEVRIYDSVTEWEKHTEPITEEGTRLGPKFVASPWFFALHAGEASPEEANAISMFVGICDRVETVTNHLTGRQWYRVKADCGFPCILALPIEVTPLPRVGSVVDGKAFLTGTTGVWQEGLLTHDNPG